MPSYISPGVYTLERDLSQYVSNLSTTIVSIVGTADTGPVNVPTLVTSAAQFVTLFGQPNPNHYLGYSALSYLEQGHMAYITRVAPADAAIAKLTVPVPANYTPFIGNWALTSNTATSATFTITNATGATGINQLVALTTASTKLPGFDFLDPTNLANINGKLGSDLLSFVTQSKVSEYVVGRTFTVTTGAGKSSSVPITGAIANLTTPTTALDVTVNASKFNSFNSPLLTPAVGSLTSKAVASAYDPTAAATLAVIGATNNVTPGTVSLIKKVSIAGSTVTECATLLGTGAGGLNSSTAFVWLTALNGLVAVASPDVTISTPLCTTSGTSITVVDGDVAKNATLIATVLSKLVEAFRLGSTALSAYANLLAAYPLCAASVASGITGVGSYDSVSGISKGYKSATVQTDGITVDLAAITLGYSGNFTFTSVNATFLTAVNMGITGTFALNLARPTWVMNTAGTNFVPSLFKFSSNGQGDFSNIAVTVDLNLNTEDASGNQQYVVSFYIRNTGLTIPLDTVSQSNFTLVETFVGTPEVLQSTINANSSYAQLKLDYSVSLGTTVDPITGGVVNGTINENLMPSFGLFADASGLGVYSGGLNVTTGTTLTPSYGQFLDNGSIGTNVTKYDIIGDLANKTGVYSVADPEKLDINLIIAPGWSADPDVAAALIKVCDPAGGGRGDCMTILDTPFGLNVQDVIDYRNNVLITGSNYAAVYYPWVQIVDSVNQKNIFVPPSGMIAGQYAYNDTVGDIFTAPAGRNRGVLYNAVSLERVLNLGERDQLTLANINAIYSEAGFGIYIRGQMTMQRATTALNRVNVRRLLLNLRKVIATASKYFEFEPGDAVTALRLKQLAESTLTQRLNQGAIRSFTVDVGSDVNTAQTLENNQLVMSISIVPTKTAEIIVEVFNILPQGQGLTLA